MKMLNEAYEVLSDPQKRREHDVWIAGQRRLECVQSPAAKSSETRSSKASSATAVPWLVRRKAIAVAIMIALVCVAFREPHRSPAPLAVEAVAPKPGASSVPDADCQVLSSRGMHVSRSVVEISAVIRNNGTTGLVAVDVGLEVAGTQRQGSRTMRVRKGETKTVRLRFSEVVPGQRASYRLACSP